MNTDGSAGKRVVSQQSLSITADETNGSRGLTGTPELREYDEAAAREFVRSLERLPDSPEWRARRAR